MKLVTAFFDLIRRDQTKRKNPLSYLENFKWIVGLNIPLIVFCDPEYAPIISSLAPLAEIIPVKLEDLEVEKYRPMVSKLITGKFLDGIYPEKFTTNYYLTIWSKFYLLQIIAKRETDKIYWIDFGIAHLKQYNPNFGLKFHLFLENIPDKIQLIQLEYFNEKSIDYSRSVCWFCGGFFGGKSEDILWFSQEFIKQLDFDLTQSQLGAEEQIMAWIVLRNPEKFTTSYGLYYSILDNLVEPYFDWEWIIYHLMGVARNDDPKFSEKIGNILWKFKDQMTLNIQVRYLDEYFIALYNVRNLVKAFQIKSILENLLLKVELKPDDRKRIENNLKYVDF